MNPSSQLSSSSNEPQKDVSGLPKPTVPMSVNSQEGESRISSISRFANGFGHWFNSTGAILANETDNGSSRTLESLAKGFVDSSASAVRAMQVRARHIASQNKRRFQSEGFDLDLTYITDSIIAMGFPAGDLSSGLFGYFEGFYRNHMDDVITFLETRHKGKYKVYNFCSERLYDASKFQGKVASLPFEEYNCPPLQLISSFCASAQSWLKEDIENVVVVHCKTGLGRTGLMICCLLLILKFFSTAEEAIHCFNQKRCVDAKALVLPSQIRYVKYLERQLKDFLGEISSDRRCMLRGFRFHHCPYWLRPSITISDHNGVIFSTKNHPKTKSLMPEDFWFKATKRSMVIFALPGEPGIAQLTGDVKIHFHDAQGDFYCWLNTTFSGNRVILEGSELDGFDKRKIPSPGFQIEIIMIDYNAAQHEPKKSVNHPTIDNTSTGSQPNKSDGDKDDVFSDSDEESNPRDTGETAQPRHLTGDRGKSTEQNSVNSIPSTSEEKINPAVSSLPSMTSSDIKAMVADASVFTFAEEDDYDSE